MEPKSSERDKNPLILKTHEISKVFGKVQALHQCSFKIYSGEITGLIGENGAGKTTCLRIISGTLIPTSGNVQFGNSLMYPEPRHQREKIGYLPEGNPLPQDLRVTEYLKFQKSMKSLSSSDLEEVIHLMELGNVLKKFIGDLSTGFRQRVGLGCAFMGWPRLIILDEPSRGLDPIQREGLRKIIKTASGRSAVIVSTHGLDELERITSRFIFLKNGHLIHDGETPDAEISLLDYFLSIKGKE
ncbi:MAG: ABC transporter ATP-binding protein [Deltaproteobacteria bacterium]|nr:ABC transporter ATP-binding protein [Deltaproteobacteria bacterium]